MAAYQELLAHFKSIIPPNIAAKEGTPEFGDIFNKWAEDVMAEFKVDSWDAIPSDQLVEIEFNPDFTGAVTTTGPAEEQIFNQLAPTVTGLIEGDAARADQAGQFAGQVNNAFTGLNNTLDWTNIVTGPNGQPTSTLLNAQNANVDTTVAAVTAAAQQGATAAQEALSKLTSAQLDNLTQSLATQQGAITTLTATQQANLAAALATQQQALQQQVASLQGNATAAATARREALAQQIAQLTAAQQGVSQARVRAAENEVTGINLGLEGTRDQLAADAAREGFVGPSSMSDAAMARAAIDARQGAARQMGGARLANAADERSIGTYGANQGYNITDIWAGDTQRAGDLGATGQAGLTTWGALQGRDVADAGAMSLAQLTGWGAEANRGINDTGATGTYNVQTDLAARIRDAQTTGAAQRSSYFDQLFPNALNAGQIRTTLPGAQAGALAGLIPYSTVGTRNALDLLSWFNSPGGPPPTSTAVTTTPNTTGNSISGLGAGLLGAGFQVANGSNWWRPRTAGATTNATTNAGGVNTSTKVTGNPWED